MRGETKTKPETNSFGIRVNPKKLTLTITVSMIKETTVGEVERALLDAVDWLIEEQKAQYN